MARIRKAQTPTVKTKLSPNVMATSANPRAVVNDAGGLNFKSTDAAARLLNQIGVPGFNEPTYYGGAGDAVLKTRENLTGLAQSIIANAEELAQSKEPQLLLSLAWWARDAAKCRTTPVVLLAVAAHYPASRKFLRKYACKICTRVDQIKEFWAIYDFLYNKGKRRFNITLKRAVNDMFGNFGEVEYMKYDNKTFPTFGDILKMTDYGMGQIPKGIKDYLVYGTVTNAIETPLIAARVALNKRDSFDNEAKTLAIRSRANWEVLVSQFGNTKEVWEFLIENKLVGYMAMLRNLRNILNARVSDKHLGIVAGLIENGAVNSKQMPTAFYSASRAIEDGFEFGRAKGKEYNPDQKQVRILQAAVNKAVENVRATMPKTGGTTAIFIDNSGSMGSRVSHMSQITNAQAAAMLALMAVGVSDDTMIYAFTDKPYEVKWRPGENNITLGQRIMDAAGDGGSTNAWTCPQLLADKGIHVDRMILISDMQCYNRGAGYGGGRAYDFAGSFQNYRNKVNKDCWLYTINIQGDAQGSTVVDDRNSNVAMLSGHSEKALELAILSETGGKITDKATGEVKEVGPMTSLDLIREQYTLVKN